MTFEQRLRAAMQAAGFKGKGAQERFRRHLQDRYGVEVSDSTVSAWLTGERRPSTAHLVAIMDALVVPMDERGDWINATVGRIGLDHIPSSS